MLWLQLSRCLASSGLSAGTCIPVPSQACGEGHGTPPNAGPMAWHKSAAACHYSDEKSAFLKHFLGRNPRFLQHFPPGENNASGSGCGRDQHQLASLRRTAGGNAHAHPQLLQTRGKKEHGKLAPHPGEQAQRLCAMGKSNRAGLLFYFFASWFLLTMLTSRSEVSWQRHGLCGTLVPAPQAAGKGQLCSWRRANSGSSPGLTPAGGFMAGGNPP